MAKKLSPVTDDMWKLCNEFNRNLVEEFLGTSDELSDKTRPQYRSGLKIWCNWVRENANNKPITEIKSMDYKRYQSWLFNQGIGESGIRFKRACVSTLNNYLVLYYENDYPTFKNFVNKNIKVPILGEVHEKLPLNPDEYKNLCDKLEEMEEWQKLAYVKFTYSTGCRRAESRQLLKEVINYEPTKKVVKTKDEDGKEVLNDISTYKTHDIRCKGRSKLGKVRKLQFDQEAMDAIKKWVEVRGEDNCPYLFVDNRGTKEVTQVGEQCFNYWASGLFTKIVGRRVHCHLFRESRATNLVVHSGRSVESAQALLGHESSNTTQIYIIRDDTNDADEAFVD